MRDLTNQSIKCPDCDSTFGNHNPTCPVGLHIDKVIEGDSAYLEEHPEVDVYDRPASWGELQELDATEAIPESIPEHRLNDEDDSRELIVTVFRNPRGRAFAWRYSE